jgi:hypothetical protein
MSSKGQVFSIFLQHWLIEENNIKKKRFQERQKQAFESWIMNRKIMIAIDYITSIFLSSEELTGGLIEIAKFLAQDVIKNKRIYGVCNICNEGLIRFFITVHDLEAMCDHCQQIFFVWFRIFYT